MMSVRGAMLVFMTLCLVATAYAKAQEPPATDDRPEWPIRRVVIELRLEDGSPLPGEPISVHSGGTRVYGLTDDLGRCALEVPVPSFMPYVDVTVKAMSQHVEMFPDRFPDVFAWMKYWRERRLTTGANRRVVWIRGDGDITETIVARKCIQIRGRIVDASGKPIKVASIVPRGPDGSESVGLRMANGEFRLDNVVPSDALELYVKHGSGAYTQHTVRATEDNAWLGDIAVDPEDMSDHGTVTASVKNLHIEASNVSFENARLKRPREYIEVGSRGVSYISDDGAFIKSARIWPGPAKATLTLPPGRYFVLPDEFLDPIGNGYFTVLDAIRTQDTDRLKALRTLVVDANSDQRFDFTLDDCRRFWYEFVVAKE
jgi:hypothetical protein